MQQAVERALDRADYVIASAQQRPPKRKRSSSGEASLYEKLYDMYVEECGKEPEAPEELRSNVNLLEKLVRRESLPCLVVSLHPGVGGYSLMLEGKHGADSETIRLPYEAGELLEYLDAEELPPALLDLLEKSQVNIFHCGCVIAQVRDYRQGSGGEPPGYQSRHILLRPTMQTLACDVQSITSDGQEWTQEDKLLLESQLILATAEPLCLDPSISVACTANRLLYNKQKMNTRPMKRSFKRYSAPSLSRQRELSGCPPPPELRVWASCRKGRDSQAGQRYDLKNSKAGSCVDMWKQRPCDLAVPSEVDVQKYARGKRSARQDVSPPGVWPAHEVRDGGAFGCEAGGEPQTTELTFMQPPLPPNNPPFSGPRRPWKEGGWEGQMSPPHPSTDDHSDGVPPESKTAAGGVVVRPDAVVPQKAKCPVPASQSSSGSAGLSGLPPGKDPEQPEMVSVRSPVQGQGVRPPPLRVRLPWSSGKSWSGNSFTPWEASSFLKSPSPAPASKPPGLSQQSSVGVNRVNPLPAALPSSASAPQRSPASRVTASSAGRNLRLPKVAGPGRGAQALARGSGPGQGCTAGTTAPARVKPSSLPSGAQSPSAVPTAARGPPVRVQFFLKHPSGLRPVTLLELPQDSLLLNTPQQPEQRLCQLIPQEQLQQASTSGPLQPVPQGSRARGAAGPKTASSAQPAVVLSRAGEGSVPQPQAAVLAALGSAESHGRPRQIGPRPAHPLPPAPASQPPPPQQAQALRILQGPVAVTTVAAQTAGPPRGQQAASQSGVYGHTTPNAPALVETPFRRVDLSFRLALGTNQTPAPRIPPDMMYFFPFALLVLVTVEQCGVRGADSPRSQQSVYVCCLAKNLAPSSLLLTGSLTDQLNCQLTDKQRMILSEVPASGELLRSWCEVGPLMCSWGASFVRGGAQFLSCRPGCLQSAYSAWRDLQDNLSQRIVRGPVLQSMRFQKTCAAGAQELVSPRIGLENDPFLEQDDTGREMLGLESQTHMAQSLGGMSKWRPKGVQPVGFAWLKVFRA
ncbi:transcription factor SPT20 homolog [Zalophus californianus]|uniref:Transcription factor SPT20 homolog n=1 Tax=Zalophus californianus TaxID=9704 RepID=A0A6P9F2K3_ZALCA|nr:transcription factor SPT20 homolog [Zalophus californianus]